MPQTTFNLTGNGVNCLPAYDTSPDPVETFGRQSFFFRFTGTKLEINVDPYGGGSIQYKLDGGGWVDASSNFPATGSTSQSLILPHTVVSGLSDTTHTIQVYIQAGNFYIHPTAAWVVTGSAPAISADPNYGPWYTTYNYPGIVCASPSDGAVVNWEPTEPDAVLRCNVVGATTAPIRVYGYSSRTVDLYAIDPTTRAVIASQLGVSVTASDTPAGDPFGFGTLPYIASGSYELMVRFRNSGSNGSPFSALSVPGGTISATPPVALAPGTVVPFGDSTANGYYNNPGPSFGHILAADLGANARNFGHVGYRLSSQDSATAFPSTANGDSASGVQYWKNQMDALPSDTKLIVVHLGINDSGFDGRGTATTSAHFQADATALLAYWKTKTPFASGAKLIWSGYGGHYQAEIAAAVAAAGSYQIAFISSTDIGSVTTSDGVHPDSPGNATLAQKYEVKSASMQAPPVLTAADIAAITVSVAPAVAALILANPANKLATDAQGRTSANVQQIAGQAAAAAAPVIFPAAVAASGGAGTLTTGERNSIADALLDRVNAVMAGVTPRTLFLRLSGMLQATTGGLFGLSADALASTPTSTARAYVQTPAAAAAGTRNALRSGATSPSRSAFLRDADGDPIDLTGAAVHYRLTERFSGTVKVDALAIIESPVAGFVSYDWAGTDTDTPGVYREEWIVADAQGREMILPEGGDAFFEVVA